MFIQKTINTNYNSYYVEIRIDQEFDDYEVKIYDKKPQVKIFGVPISIDPIIQRKFDLNVPVKSKVIELITLWERPIKYREELESWDGIISDGEDPKEKSIEDKDETNKKKEKAEFIRFHDWQHGSKLIRVK